MVESDSDASQEDDNTAEFVVESDDEASTGAEVVGFMGTGKKKTTTSSPCPRLSQPKTYR